MAGNKHGVGTTLYDIMGLPVLPNIQENIIDEDIYWGQISYEVFPEYVGDYFISLGDYPKDWESNSVINSIETIRQGRTFVLDPNTT
ncbi:MAG: hypothetical protein ACK5LT_09655 [Lachnospirales bacterium]